MNAVWNSYGQLCGCPEIFKKSCKFFCRELDIRVAQAMKNHIRKTFFINYFLHLVTNIAAIDRHSKSGRHYQVVIGILTAKRLLYLILFLLYINKALCHKSRYINFALTGIGL